MRLVLSLILLMTCTVVKSQNSETFELSGIRKYTYNEKGERSQKLSYDTENNLTKKVAYFYDNRANKIRTEKRLANDSLLAIYKYEYDKKKLKLSSQKNDFVKHIKSGKIYLNNAIGKSEQTAYYSKGELSKTNHYQYNNRGDVKELISYNVNREILSQYTYKYRYQNTSFEKETYNKENSLIKLSKYILDEKGNKIESYSFYYSGRRKNSKRLYTYDEQGRRIGVKVYTVVD